MLKCICMSSKISGGHFNNIIALTCLLHKNYTMTIKTNKPSKSVAFNVNKDETIVTIHNFSDISCIVRTISTFLHCAMTFLKVSVDPTQVRLDIYRVQVFRALLWGTDYRSIGDKFCHR